ncbi:MAG: hypothetical protein OXE52_10735 [Chloroflexi bacterium]|nr:hypothetical protein [Chloroflexota bacterium]
MNKIKLGVDGQCRRAVSTRPTRASAPSVVTENVLRLLGALERV